MSEQEEKSTFDKAEDSILFLGRDLAGKEMWSSTAMVLTHMFVLGSTGSGKTEFLTNVMANVMAWGSGGIFIDGKGDVALPAKLHAMATAMGREEDLFILNFIGGAASTGSFVSHTVNPFAVLTADELAQIMTTLLPKSERESMWTERAISLMVTVINVLAWLRDARSEPLTIGKIRKSLVLNNLLHLRKRISGLDDVPSSLLEEFDFFLQTIPGYDPQKFTDQTTTVFEQYGFLSMQWTRVVGMLATGYGHILDTEMPDIDIRDVMINRRILVVLLPSLERSTSDIANIGGLMVGMIKSMLGQALKTPVEGGWSTVVRNRITNARYPFLILFDEVGQYLSDGMGTMSQQARSLNVGMIFATQDLESLAARNAMEFNAILSNTNTKIFMKTESPKSYHIEAALAVHTETALSSGTGKMAERSAERQRIADQLNHRMNPARSEELKRALDGINEDFVNEASTKAKKSLSLRLKGFSAGQMIALHGQDCVEGRAGYVRIDEDTDEHSIIFGRYASLPSYGRSALRDEAAEKRVEEVISRLDTAMNIARMSSKNAKEQGFKKSDYATMTKIDSMQGMSFPPVLYDLESLEEVWASFLVHQFMAETNLMVSTIYQTLRTAMEDTTNRKKMHASKEDKTISFLDKVMKETVE